MGKKKDKKDKDKKAKKDKKKKKEKKKDEKKKRKKQESSDSSSRSGSGSESSAGAEKPTAAKAPAEKAEAKKQKLGEGVSPKIVELPPPEEGIQRFEYTAEETGPLGLRFSGGFPPLILAVLPDSHAKRKGVPENFEVHAVNGHALVPQNVEVVMLGLKSRPVVLDVRPQGWIPKEKAKELAKRREREVAEKRAMVEMEEKRREHVAREAVEQAEREAAEQAAREEEERKERQELERLARERLAERKAREEEFEKVLAQDAAEMRQAAGELMDAPYGTKVRLEGTQHNGRGLPLRLFARRKEVAWVWAGEANELIGGGQQDPNDTWA